MRVASLRVCELKVCESHLLKEKISCERCKRHIFIMGKVLACSKFLREVTKIKMV